MNDYFGFRGRRFFRVVALLACALIGSVAHGADTGLLKESVASDAQRARALLGRAVIRYQQAGDAAFAEFNSAPDFVDGELYVWVLGTNGVMLASGGPSAALIGRNVRNMLDAFGTPFFYDMLEKAKTSDTGVVEYRWLNRLHHKPERKVTFFRKVGTRLIAVGYYIPRASPAQAVALLDKAVVAVRNDPAKAIAAFNSLNGGFIEDDLYVFVVGLNDGKFLAHGVTHRLVGTDGNALTDPDGRPIIHLMLETLKTDDHGELDYAWRNPVTRKVEHKHTLFRKVGPYLVAVGYYTR